MKVHIMTELDVHEMYVVTMISTDGSNIDFETGHVLLKALK